MRKEHQVSKNPTIKRSQAKWSTSRRRQTARWASNISLKRKKSFLKLKYTLPCLLVLHIICNISHVSSRWLCNSSVEILTPVWLATQYQTATKSPNPNNHHIYLPQALMALCPNNHHSSCQPSKSGVRMDPMWPMTALICFPMSSSHGWDVLVAPVGLCASERHVMPEYLSMFCNLPEASAVSGPIIRPGCAL